MLHLDTEIQLQPQRPWRAVAIIVFFQVGLLMTVGLSAKNGVEEVEKYPPSVLGIAAGSSGGAPVIGGSYGSTLRYYDVGIGFTSYEIDLFGRIRSLNHQRLQQSFGFVETRRSTQISLVAEVANAYLTLLADQELLRVTQDTLGSQGASYKLTKMGYDGGIDTALDLRQAETSVDIARGNLAPYTRQAAQDQNALVLLLGTPLPADLPPGAGLDEQKLLEGLLPGLPSDLLARRPDLLATDQALVEATGESYRLSDMGFRGGVNDYLSVLDSQRSLYTA
jgi:outer membrane protein, multidrug efflux system